MVDGNIFDVSFYTPIIALHAFEDRRMPKMSQKDLEELKDLELEIDKQIKSLEILKLPLSKTT